MFWSASEAAKPFTEVKVCHQVCQRDAVKFPEARQYPGVHYPSNGGDFLWALACSFTQYACSKTCKGNQADERSRCFSFLGRKMNNQAIMLYSGKHFLRSQTAGRCIEVSTSLSPQLSACTEAALHFLCKCVLLRISITPTTHQLEKGHATHSQS